MGPTSRSSSSAGWMKPGNGHDQREESRRARTRHVSSRQYWPAVVCGPIFAEPVGAAHHEHEDEQRGDRRRREHAFGPLEQVGAQRLAGPDIRSGGADLLGEFEGSAGRLLALIAGHEAQHDHGHDEKRDDEQHTSPSSRGVPENAGKREIFAAAGPIPIAEIGAGGAICNQLKRMRVRNSRIFA